MDFTKILVALDFSALDNTLIEHGHFIAKNFGVNSIQFIHVMPSYTPPSYLDSHLEKIIKKDTLLPERYQNRLANNIQSVFGDTRKTKIDIFVEEGTPQRKLLSLIKEHKPDLLVLGKKKSSDGSGIIAQRIARKAECAVWFITEEANTTPQNILVPVDFSSHSLRALKTALHLKEQSEEVSITALHLIDIPMTGYKINKNKDEIIRRLEVSAKHSFDQFLAQNQLKETSLNFKMLFNDAFDVSRYVRETAFAEKSDLIILGAKGRSGLSGFVFGSVTEKLISSKETPPVLVVR